VISAVVKHLNLKLIERVIEEARVLDDALCHGVFIEHRELHSDLRQALEVALGQINVLAMFQIEINEDVAMQAVESDGAKYRDVNGGEAILKEGHPHRALSLSKLNPDRSPAAPRDWVRRRAIITVVHISQPLGKCPGISCVLCYSLEDLPPNTPGISAR
jgi:hypothetical protein